jgi:hypothetical protein
MPVNSLVAHALLSSLDTGELTSVRAAALQGAVHGWMEGHLGAAGHREGPESPGPMPSPPFPDPSDPDGALRAITDEVAERYDDDQITAAFLHALALGIAAGDHDGRQCAGCSIAHDPDDTHLKAANVRAGLGSFVYRPPGG